MRPQSSRDPASSASSSRTATIGGRVQRDVRLQAALALLVGIALVAVPLFIWGRGRGKTGGQPSSSNLAALSDDAGPPTVIFGDAGASVAVDAGGRGLTFGESKYLKCQDPGPGKTSPEKCDHLGPIEGLVTKAIADHAAGCLPPLTQAQTINVVVDVSFKRKKVVVHAGKEGSTMSPPLRTKAIGCMMKGLPAPTWDTIGHAHQHYAFQFLTTVGASSAPPPAPPP